MSDETEEQTDRLYLEGERAALVGMIRYCLREIGADDPDAAHLRWLVEREEVIVKLRQVCGRFGDNDWDETLHLGDVIETHLWDHIEAPTEPAPDSPMTVLLLDGAPADQSACFLSGRWCTAPPPQEGVYPTMIRNRTGDWKPFGVFGVTQVIRSDVSGKLLWCPSDHGNAIRLEEFDRTDMLYWSEPLPMFGSVPDVIGPPSRFGREEQTMIDSLAVGDLVWCCERNMEAGGGICPPWRGKVTRVGERAVWISGFDRETGKPDDDTNATAVCGLRAVFWDRSAAVAYAVPLLRAEAQALRDDADELDVTIEALVASDEDELEGNGRGSPPG